MRAGFDGPGAAEHDRRIGLVGRRYRSLFAIDDIFVAVSFDAQPQIGGVRAAPRFGQGDGEESFTRRQAREPGSYDVRLAVLRQNLAVQRGEEIDIGDAQVGRPRPPNFSGNSGAMKPIAPISFMIARSRTRVRSRSWKPGAMRSLANRLAWLPSAIRSSSRYGFTISLPDMRLPVHRAIARWFFLLRATRLTLRISENQACAFPEAP